MLFRSEPSYEMRELCRWCLKDGGGEVRDGFIRESNGQDVVRCSQCERACYNAPKRETGKPQRKLGTREGMSQWQKERVIAECGAHCHWCGQSPAEHKIVLTVAHLLSVHDAINIFGMTEDEANDDENLLPCCESCNSHTGKISVPLRLAFRLLKARLAHKKMKEGI